MALPAISFKEFLNNPIVALLFMALMAIGYLYYDNKSTLTRQVEALQLEVKSLQQDYKELNDKLISTLERLHKN
jgi:hypothetical protein